MKKHDDIPEVFSCISKVFEHVKNEILENDQDFLNCMLSLYADDPDAKQRYKLLDLDFRGEIEYEDDPEETPVCNISSICIPLDFTKKGKESCSPLLETLGDNRPDWLRDESVELVWKEEYETGQGLVSPLDIRVENVSPELAARFITLVSSLFLPEGERLEIWAEYHEESEDGAYEWIRDFVPDPDETITVKPEDA